jgi:outer membrane receptor protein involved in Fe transport
MTTGWEAGFDVDLLDRRINAGLTYYSTSTTDQTVPTGVSIASGFSSYLRNTGEVTNKGLEALLHYTPIRGKDWTVTVGGNYTYNNNKVVSISDDVPRLQLSTGGSAQVYAQPGLFFPVLMGTDYVRDDEGRVIVDRLTGYPTLDPTLKVLGNTNPKHRLGLDLEVKYKSFRLWALAEYRGSYYVYHDMGSTMDFSGSSIRTVQFDRERFVFPNSSYEDPSRPGTYIANTSVQVRDGGSGFWANGDGAYNMTVGSNYVVSGDFWKIREISLSYDLPRSLLARTKYIKAATLSVQGRNLFLWTPDSNIYTDPEYNFSETNAIGVTTLGQSPPSRYYGATLSLTF